MLFVLYLKRNLISTPQLLQSQSDYFMSIAKEVCMIQDHTIMKVIGARRLIDGVYCFQ